MVTDVQNVSVKEMMERVAHLKMAGIGTPTIAKALEIEHGELVSLMEKEEYVEIENGVNNAEVERQKSFNDAWDGLEARSLDIVAANLETNLDADFALRVAMAANKSVKRGRGLIPGQLQAQTGMRAGINLPSAFINLVQNNVINNNVMNLDKVKNTGEVGYIARDFVKSAERVKKPMNEIDSLSPSQVDKLLGGFDETMGGIGNDEALEKFGIEFGK